MRLKQLDFLRTIAVLLVLGRHWYLPATDQFMSLWGRAGWIGVDLFFVLSGFLISGLLFSEYKEQGSISFKRFFIRRGFKIYPAFYVMIATAFIFEFFTHKVQLMQYIHEIFFVQNYFSAVFSHTWTLAIEEHFYLMLPLLLIFLIKFSKKEEKLKSIPIMFCVVAVVCLALRIITSLMTDVTQSYMYPTHLRIDSLFFGVFLSYFYYFRGDKLKGFIQKYKWPLVILGIILIFPAFFLEVQNFFMHTFGLSFLYLGFGGLLIVMIYAEPFKGYISNKIFSFIAYIGIYSYSIYLWHMAIRTGMLAAHDKFISLPYYIEVIAYVTASIVFGILIAKLIEVPFLKIRNKFFPSKVDMFAKAKSDAKETFIK